MWCTWVVEPCCCFTYLVYDQLLLLAGPLHGKREFWFPFLLRVIAMTNFLHPDVYVSACLNVVSGCLNVLG